ncbi:hypothetical protein W824_03290 [Clavibacter cf. michiganensis LMG 26808]|nr:hypothetical protein W824_03290 [Clavibacter cf. michiganensis LMG 26808]
MLAPRARCITRHEHERRADETFGQTNDRRTRAVASAGVPPRFPAVARPEDP